MVLWLSLQQLHRKGSMNAEQGRLYEFTWSDGSTTTLRFDGHGEWMKPIWVEPVSGEIINLLPPYISYKSID
jgi:hypothetical protein